MSNIISPESPPYPLIRESLCVFLVLTECYGSGRVQLRVSYVDGEFEQLIFGTPEHTLNFINRSPLELLSTVFRLNLCPFPRPGRYSVQFWYDGECVHECPLQLR